MYTNIQGWPQVNLRSLLFISRTPSCSPSKPVFLGVLSPRVPSERHSRISIHMTNDLSLFPYHNFYPYPAYSQLHAVGQTYWMIHLCIAAGPQRRSMSF